MATLTPHFDIKDICNGEQVPAEIMANAKWFAETVLEPARVGFGHPIKINSWYRSPEKNANTVGASKKSFHMTANATDCDAIGATNKDLLEYFFENKDTLVFDKVIAEHWDGKDYSWIHIQARPETLRKEFYIASGTRAKPVYTPYNG